MWRWFKKDPCKRWPFMLFILLAVATIVWIFMYLSSSSTGYILAGIVSLLTCGMCYVTYVLKIESIFVFCFF